jgi:UDP-2,3-diacylglucosamine hydrolase
MDLLLIVSRMPEENTDTLGLIAGKGTYPRLLAQSAKEQGVRKLVILAFRGETARETVKYADKTVWLRLGSLTELLDACRNHSLSKVVMAGQLTPTSLFRVRLDSAMRELLAGLAQKNAHSIFGAIVQKLESTGIAVLPASEYMESHMPAAGTLTRRAPDETELADIELGRKVAHATSGLEIGQTVVIKTGTILAVEAFEGTDQAILRAGKLGGPGCVVVKVAKQGHDMRFDIPVIGDAHAALNAAGSRRRAGGRSRTRHPAGEG